MSLIFVLDDDKNRLAKFQQKLIGNVVTMVSTVGEAIKAFEENQVFDIAFLDHDLDGKVFVESGKGTGYEVAQWLAENVKKMPRVIIVHSFNEKGANKIKEVLPQAYLIPGAWLLLNDETLKIYTVDKE